MLDKVSLIHPYYKDRKRLDLQFGIWSQWSERVCKAVDITIVDDGSPEPLQLTSSEQEFFERKGIKFAVFRILEDLKWNTPGALNLGVLVSPQPWVLFQDSDCFFESSMWEKILDLDHPINKIGKFERKRYGNPETENLENHRYLNCTMLMHKHVFMHLGGFDEDFTGQYSGGYGFFDTEFDARAEKWGVWSEYCYGPAHRVYREIIAGEWMPSVCGEPVPRDPREHHKKNKIILNSKKAGTTSQNRHILNFSWQCTYSNWIKIQHERRKPVPQ